MKAEDLKGKTLDELTGELLQLRKEGFNLRFQMASGQLENTARIRQVRRDIARIKTVLGGAKATANAAKGKSNAAKGKSAAAAGKANAAAGKANA